jgi:hypothetical protein
MLLVLLEACEGSVRRRMSSPELVLSCEVLARQMKD